VATSVEVRIPLTNGISVVDGSGYPIQVKGNHAIIQPGNLLSGQSKKIFLTLRVPAHREQTFAIKGINARYRYKDSSYTVNLDEAFQIACVKDRQAVYSSIDKSEWEEKVVKEDINRLREEVAGDIKKGSKQEALKRIEEYYRAQQSVNAVVASPKVATSLDKDLGGLRDMVEETFQGAPQEVELKQKRNSKVLQYEGYSGRRNRK